MTLQVLSAVLHQREGEGEEGEGEREGERQTDDDSIIQEQQSPVDILRLHIR